MVLGAESLAGGARRPCCMPCPRRAAWGEFAALLAARVGEASRPGPVATHGQRTLRLAPGGLAFVDDTASVPSFDGRPREGPRASQGFLAPLPARPGVQRTLDFGSTGSIPVPHAGSPPGDEEETPGDVRSFFTEFERLDVDSSGQQPFAPGEARRPKRIRVVGGQTCAACTQPIMRGRSGYGCSDCAVAYCSAVCRGRGFGTHWRGADAGANALAVAAPPDPGPPSRAIADVVIPATDDFRGMLAAAAARPALQTMGRIPRKHRVRTAEVLGDLYVRRPRRGGARRAEGRGGACRLRRCCLAPAVAGADAPPPQPGFIRGRRPRAAGH